MDLGYVVLPFLTWFIAGSTKFLINSIHAQRLAFHKMGYGGMPSNHSAIVSSIVAFIAFREGISTPIFGVAVTLAFIVMMDAGGLREHIGAHARALNKCARGDIDVPGLRESIGHSKAEILVGAIIGIGSAWLVYSING